MNITRRHFVRYVLIGVFAATFVFGARTFFKNGSFFHWGDPRASEASPDPLPYESVGNYPAIDEDVTNLAQEKEYTLELGTCQDKDCIAKTLQSLSRKGIEAFYTPSKADGKLIFHIRKGIFTSRRSAEKAQMNLTKEKRVTANVVEL